MFSRVWFFSLLSLLILLLPRLSMAVEPMEPTALSPLEERYQEILLEEREQLRRGEFVEDLVSGLAALTIGTYGYYNDNKGLTTKLIYSGTQTAGVILISNSIRRLDRPSLLLSLDRSIRKRENMDLERFKKLVVRIDERVARSDQKQLAYTSLLLASIYGYNAYRETKIIGLRNVFGFLSFNFFIVSGVNFFRLWNGPQIFQPVEAVSSVSLLTGKDILLQWQKPF